MLTIKSYDVDAISMNGSEWDVSLHAGSDFAAKGKGNKIVALLVSISYEHILSLWRPFHIIFRQRAN